MWSSATSAARSRARRRPSTEPGPHLPTAPRRLAGQALVETALVFPVLVLCCLGAMQVVLYVHARDVLVSATFEGARLAAEDGRTLEEGTARATALIAAGLGGSVEAVHVQPEADQEVVSLHIDARLRPILPLPAGDGLPLQADGRVARERFRPAGGLR